MKLTPLAMTLALALGAATVGTTAIAAPAARQPFLWENATVYFLLTDRFNNAFVGNDLAYGRKADAGPLRGFMGGDLAGITTKINEGYFDSLGVSAIWVSPPVEQIHEGTDEGTGKSYGFHGYWAADFTAVDANLGTENDFRNFVDAAHAHGIRVLLDVVMNQTGPVTETDYVWPDDWVRTGPQCTYKDAKTTIECTLVKNLPDFRTDSDTPVELPENLAAKWQREGRFEREVKELDEFFARTGYPRAPRYYLMKWHSDWVRKYGVDGFRADTVKHVEAKVWKELGTVASAAYEDWKRANPDKKLSDDKFFMTAEVFNYNIAQGQVFDLGGGQTANYYQNGFNSMINFGMVYDAAKDYESLFSSYSNMLHGGALDGYSVLNYLDSHDYDKPFDATRKKPFESANKLLLAPGAAQIYYGDETARKLDVAEAVGDAKLRSFMNWGELEQNAQRDGYRIADVRVHWAKLGLFRKAHVAVGAGVHQQLQAKPYVFKRTYDKGALHDKVVVALDLPADKPASINLHGVFANGQKVKDYYSGKTAVVKGGSVTFGARNAVVLIGQE
ncbi:alpha-amlyase [Duganella sp. BJB488]|uniref:alpha-amylase family glycosyl hydrolase n=1 Tax=unclassified Duganella TaxID=2636909 RepID=UPI000E34150F|nr:MULTISPECIES: alpha-amylase family glycosyl hydrolase [unclassified Duganella]RFP26075.1 alpha-amlyase [Duganella sp. BJB489]RFP28187.1 alpha-amlyase [Duganella sp. BJB488]RFP37005.1 alpha-amlyase [Duganella sp. BJB480]